MLAPFYSDPVALAAARAKYVAKMYPQPVAATPPKPPKPVKRDYILVATQPLLPKASVAEIIADVAKAHGFTPDDITGFRRSQLLNNARFAAYHAAVEARRDMSLRQIARQFGDRDHTTLSSALAKMARNGVPQPPVGKIAGDA